MPSRSGPSTRVGSGTDARATAQAHPQGNGVAVRGGEAPRPAPADRRDRRLVRRSRLPNPSVAGQPDAKRSFNAEGHPDLRKWPAGTVSKGVTPSAGRMAGELGLEPRMTVPKTGVLPLHHGSIPLFVKRCKNKQRIGIKQVPFKKCFIFLYFLRGKP